MADPMQLLAQARQAADSGNAAKARKFYKHTIAAAPRHAGLLTEAGVFEAQNENLKAARTLLERARSLEPADPDILFNLGQIERAEGKWDTAFALFSRTSEIDKTHNDALFAAGEALYYQRNYQSSLEWFDRALDQQPRDVEALFLKAGALRALSRDEQAAGIYRQVLELQPNSPEAKLNLAFCLTGDSHIDQAADLVSEIDRVDGLPDSALVQAAGIYLRQENHTRARELANRAIERNVDVIDALLLKAQIHIWNGDFDAAESVINQALEKEPQSGGAYDLLGQIKRLSPDKAEAVANIFNTPSADSEDRVAAGFAFYQILKQEKRFDEAFDALKRANTLQYADRPFNVARHIDRLQRTIAAFSRELLDRRRQQSNLGSGAIFIVGMPRSGTTLTEQILATYDNVHAGGERRDIARLRGAFSAYPEEAANMTNQQADELGTSLLKSMFKDAPDVQFATDKLPGNYAFIGLIRTILPAARIVYCRRDPMDNALSLFEQNFGPNLPYAANLIAIADVYKAHLEYMDHWINTCGLDVHTLDYDDFVREPEVHSRRLTEHIGLDWTPKCLDTGGVERTISTASQWQARQPINASSVGRSRQFEKQLQPFTRALEDRS